MRKVIEMERRQHSWQRGDEHWQLESGRMFSAESMAAIPALRATDEALAAERNQLSHGQQQAPGERCRSAGMGAAAAFTARGR